MMAIHKKPNAHPRPRPAQNVRQIVIDFATDTIYTYENSKVQSESLSRNPHWRDVSEVRSFYQRQNYKLVVEDEHGVVYEKSIFGRKPLLRVDHEPMCPICGGARYQNSAYCLTHYLERQKEQQSKSYAKKNPCQYEGCTEPRVKRKKFCVAHLDAAAVEQAAKPAMPVIKAVPAPAASSFETKIDPCDCGARRYCSYCYTAKSPSQFDLSKDGPFGTLHFKCRDCEAIAAGAQVS